MHKPSLGFTLTVDAMMIDIRVVLFWRFRISLLSDRPMHAEFNPQLSENSISCQQIIYTLLSRFLIRGRITIQNATFSGLSKLDRIYLRPPKRNPREDTKGRFVHRHAFIFERLQMLDSGRKSTRLQAYRYNQSRHIYASNFTQQRL